MRYWFDTEFIEDGKTIDLISIGIVAEDGRMYYAVSTQFNRVKLFDNPWLVEHVAPHLPWDPLPPGTPLTWVTAEPDWSSEWWKDRAKIARDIQAFCDPQKYGKPEFWAYYADYDWVALCQLFGRMIDLPRDWPMWCRDIKQLAWMLGDPKLPEQGKDEHHALADARWNREAFEFLAREARWDDAESVGWKVSHALNREEE